MNYLRVVLAVLIVGLALPGLAEMIYTPVTLNLGVGGGSDYSPIMGDFDGDGKLDPTLYQETTGDWYTGLSTNNYIVSSVNLGGPGYTPVAGDFDGDGKADPAVYQETTGNWYARLSGSQYGVSWLPNFGEPGYQPVPGDYDGIGESQMAVYQAASGNWYLLRGETVEVTDTNVMAVMYSNAVVNSYNVVASKIRRDLTAITEDNTSLIWRTNSTTGAREVLVTSFMTASVATQFYHIGQNNIQRDAWITLAPDLKNICRNYTGTNLLLRLKQVLGLPITSANDYIVEYYVNPLYLIRPSRDPEVTDQEGEVAFRTNIPYVVNMVSTNYITWFQTTMATRNYGMTNGVWNGYPWTQLGYTYDWSKTGNNVMGLSEFVLPASLYYTAGTTTLVYAVTITGALNYATSPDNRAIQSRDSTVNIVPPEDH